jgi:N6-adenosine-specific RNA methylase IME4
MGVAAIGEALFESGLWRPCEHAHLYLWYTDNHLIDALKLSEVLGFRYVRTFQWIKLRQDGKALRLGIGQYARGAHEGALFCVRGKGKDSSVMTDRRDIPSCFLARHPTNNGKRVHSAKPEESFALVEARSHGPYYEFFSRSARENWTNWGDEV